MTFPVIPRHSTTLMLAVRTQLTNQQSVPSVGYKLLMLQRGSNMKFMVRTLALYPCKDFGKRERGPTLGARGFSTLVRKTRV